MSEEFTRLLDVDTLRYLRKAKEEKLEKKESKANSGSSSSAPVKPEEVKGATGPDDEFLDFPDYDGQEPPRDKKKAFTHFCTKTRKEVKSSLASDQRKNKKMINGILKQRWLALADDETQYWRKLEEWDRQRFERDNVLYEKVQTDPSYTNAAAEAVPKKRKGAEPAAAEDTEQAPPPRPTLSIPKKRNISL